MIRMVAMTRAPYCLFVILNCTNSARRPGTAALDLEVRHVCISNGSKLLLTVLHAALDTYEPRLVAKADLLMDRLALVADKPVNVTELSMFYVFDVMGEVGENLPELSFESGLDSASLRTIADDPRLLL